MGLTESPLCRKRGAQDETSAHILCRCEAVASLRLLYLCSFFLEPGDIMSMSLGAIWSFSKAAGLPWEVIGAQRARNLRPRCIRALGPWTHVHQSVCLSMYPSIHPIHPIHPSINKSISQSINPSINQSINQSDVSIILKCVFRKWDWGNMDWVDLGHDRDGWRRLIHMG
jgi:hypothetical protein